MAERTWQSLRKLAQCMLAHARLPGMYLYHALLHACNVFNILPLKDLVTLDGTVSTPFELFVGSKPMVSHFRVFGCHALLRSGQSQWMASLRIIARALSVESEESTLDFPLHRKDCSFISLQPGRLSYLEMSYLEMSYVMRPLPPLWLKLGDLSMML